MLAVHGVSSGWQWGRGVKRQGGIAYMQIPIEQIRIKEGRRSLDSGYVKELAASIREMGLLNPITIDRENVLIAGLHRMEAAKMLGWTEIPCTVSSLEGLAAELAEIDENIVRSDISALEYGEILLRRKEIYETLHPETKNGGDRRSGKTRSAKCTSDPARSFVEDTAEKLGVNPCTVRRQIQTAKNLSPETKEIIRGADAKLSKKSALKLSRLEPEQQKEAATLLASREIRSVDEYAAKEKEAPEEISAQETSCGLTASILSGMALFVKTYETEMSDRTFAMKLSQVDPDEINRRGRADFSTNSVALRYARVILEKYNGQRGGRKLPYRFKG